MSETTNYGLYLEDDASAKFQTWRQKMNGSGQSNMVKIDTALGEKAEKHFSYGNIAGFRMGRRRCSFHTRTLY